MNQFWIISLCILLCSSAFADNKTGLHTNEGFDGEGAAIFEQDRLNADNVVQFTLFTYMERCHNRAYDNQGDLLEELQDYTYTIVVDEEEVLIRLVDMVEGLAAYDHCRKIQVWFITGNHPLSGGQAVGPIYISEPFQDSGSPLADVQDVGLFVMKEVAGGFEVEVLQTGRVLDENSELYMKRYHLQYLFGPTLSTPELFESSE